jgi:hypothetical protein
VNGWGAVLIVFAAGMLVQWMIDHLAVSLR